MSDGRAGPSAVELDSAEVEELDRRVFCRAGTRDSSLGALSTAEVKGEMLATRWTAGMRVRKLLGLDILDLCLRRKCSAEGGRMYRGLQMRELDRRIDASKCKVPTKNACMPFIPFVPDDATTNCLFERSASGIQKSRDEP